MCIRDSSTTLISWLPPYSPSSVQGMGFSAVNFRWEAWKESTAPDWGGSCRIRAWRLSVRSVMLVGLRTRMTSNSPSSSTTRSVGRAFIPPTEMVLHTIP